MNVKEITITIGAATMIAFSGFATAAECPSKKLAKSECASACKTSGDIVAIATKAGSFHTLLAAAKAAGLVDVLQSAGPLTIFAPTDEAFAKLPKNTVASLLKPENKEKLRNILSYHVVSGKVDAAHVVKLTEAKTVQGQSVAIAVQSGKVMIDGATVIKADVQASNGIIHVIDSVILPKAIAPKG